MKNGIEYSIEYRHNGRLKRNGGTTYPDGRELFAHVSDLEGAGAEVWKITIRRD